VDRSTIVNTIKEAGIEQCTLIADKGFYSKQNTSFLDEQKIKFILPLQSNTQYITDDFVADLSTKKYDDFLVYHKRIVWYKKEKIGNKNHFIYIYMDTDLKQTKDTLFLEKTKEQWKDYTRENFKDSSKKNYIAFISNIDTTPENIYLQYKSRWEIEECFDYLKNSLKVNTPYQDSNEKIEAWAFINHISLLLFYNLINKLKEQKISDKYTAEDIINIGKNIHKIILKNGETIIAETTRKEKDLFESLGVLLA